MSRIPDFELLTALQWLCNPKLKILEKQNQKTPSFKDDEIIKVAMNFYSQHLLCSFVPTKIFKFNDEE